MKKNILITGSSGFIGRNLKEQLREKYNLLCPSHSELELTSSGAIKEYFEKNPIDIVIHCAFAGTKGYKGAGAEKISQQIDIVSQNLRMFFNIVDNLGNRRLINFGSGAEYDKTRVISRVKETDFGKNLPQENYAFSKYAISKYIENSGKDIINLRFFGVYGQYEDYKVRFISKSICRNLFGLPIIIKQNCIFDYLYIDDAIKIIEYFIENRGSEKVYNVGSGSLSDLLAIAQLINEISEKPSEVIVEKTGFSNEYTCDISRLNEEIKDFKFIELRDGIKRLYDYYKNNIDKIDKNSIF